MTTASSNATLAQDTYAHMQNWVGELCSQLLACGLVQTNDSGQLTLTGVAPTAIASWGSAALPTGTGVANTVANILFTFNDTLAKGTLSATALRSGGSGYTNGTNTAVVVTGATSGATANATCTVSGGVAANLASISASGNFIVGEKLTVTGIGAGTGANWTATALSSGHPIIFRLDFGGGNATTDAQMWINVGAGTNGSGTIAGAAGTSKMTQVACFGGAVAASLTTTYQSNFVYSAADSVCGCFSKMNGITAGQLVGGFWLFRTNDTSGAPDGTAAVLISNSINATGTASAGSSNYQQCMTWNGSGVGSTVYGPQNTYSAGGIQFNTGGAAQPGGVTQTLVNNTVYIFPLMTYSPDFRMSAFMGNLFNLDVSIGNTFSTTLIGSTPRTFLNIGPGLGTNQPFGGGGANSAMSTCVVFQ